MRILRCRLLAGGLLMLVVSGLAITASAQNIAVTHCQGKCPAYEAELTASRANVVIHHLYAAGLNGDTGRADWVAYRLSKDAVGVASLLPRFWQPDRLLRISGTEEFIELESSVLSLSEISTGSNPYGGFTEPARVKQDRARLAPITSFANTPYWSELNNLSNMVPMPTPLRVGAWLQLEQALNQLVATQEELYVVSGPLFVIDRVTSSPAALVEMEPAAFYKVVVGKSGIAAFVFPQNLQQHIHYCSQLGKLDQIERMGGLQLFPDRKHRQSRELLSALGCADI